MAWVAVQGRAVVCRGPSMLDDALTAIGRDVIARGTIVAALQAHERRAENRFTRVRDQVTGPIVDALHADSGVLRKTLVNGLVIDFLYRSKIARDFVMAEPERPDHVWEPQTTKLLLHLANAPGDILIGGAYFGDHAILLADAGRGRSLCHAFEADEAQAAMLERNAALNGLDNIRVQARALWSNEVSRVSFVGNDALGSLSLSDTGLPTTTLDAYVRSTEIERVGLIMLDLEGSELMVLRGAGHILQTHRPHIVFEVHRAYIDWSNGLRDTEIFRYLTGLGYTVLAVRDFQSNVDMADRPVELVPLDSVVLDGPPHGFNLVAVQDPAVLRGDGFRWVPDVSPKLLWHGDPRLHHPLDGL